MLESGTVSERFLPFQFRLGRVGAGTADSLNHVFYCSNDGVLPTLYIVLGLLFSQGLDSRYSKQQLLAISLELHPKAILALLYIK